MTLTMIPPVTTLAEWIGTYRPDIRTIVDWGRLSMTKVKVVRVWDLTTANLYYPWAVSGSWMGGAKLQKVALGTTDAIVRAPSIRLNATRRILLDRCHRISQVKPRLLILDELQLDKTSRTFFADTLFDGINK